MQNTSHPLYNKNIIKTAKTRNFSGHIFCKEKYVRNVSFKYIFPYIEYMHQFRVFAPFM